jgi:hypothetical protein
MASGFPPLPKIGGPVISRGANAPGEGIRKQRMARPAITRVPTGRRDYSKGALGAENPLGVSEGQKSNFGRTGLTGET